MQEAGRMNWESRMWGFLKTQGLLPFLYTVNGPDSCSQDGPPGPAPLRSDWLGPVVRSAYEISLTWVLTPKLYSRFFFFFLVNAEKKEVSDSVTGFWEWFGNIQRVSVIFVCSSALNYALPAEFEQKTVSHVGYRDKIRKGKRDTCCSEDWRGRIQPQIYSLCGPQSVGSQGSDGRTKGK